MQRLILYTKDVQGMTGKSDKASRDLIRKVKKRYNKSRDQYITAEVFSEFTGIPLEMVLSYLKQH